MKNAGLTIGMVAVGLGLASIAFNLNGKQASATQAVYNAGPGEATVVWYGLRNVDRTQSFEKNNKRLPTLKIDDVPTQSAELIEHRQFDRKNPGGQVQGGLHRVVTQRRRCPVSHPGNNTGSKLYLNGVTVRLLRSVRILLFPQFPRPINARVCFLAVPQPV